MFALSLCRPFLPRTRVTYFGDVEWLFPHLIGPTKRVCGYVCFKIYPCILKYIHVFVNAAHVCHILIKVSSFHTFADRNKISTHQSRSKLRCVELSFFKKILSKRCEIIEYQETRVVFFFGHTRFENRYLKF